MGEEKACMKFSIFFNAKDPRHLKAAEIIGRQGYRGKAQYLVKAVLHYEGYEETPGDKRPARLDERAIEAVVYRILRDRDVAAIGTQTKDIPKKGNGMPALPSEKAIYDDAMDEIGEDGLNAVLSALDMFRNG